MLSMEPQAAETPFILISSILIERHAGDFHRRVVGESERDAGGRLVICENLATEFVDRPVIDQAEDVTRHVGSISVRRRPA